MPQISGPSMMQGVEPTAVCCLHSRSPVLTVTWLCQDAGSSYRIMTYLMMAEEHPKSGILLKRQRADAQ